METAKRDTVIALIILVLFVAAAVWYWQASNGGAPSSLPTSAQTSPVFSYSAANPIVIHHTLGNPPPIKGATIGKVNNYSGTVPAFSNCDRLSVGMAPAASGSSHFTLKITDTNAGTCPVAAISTIPFTTGVALKNSATVPTIDSVTVNGASVPFKLVEGN
ncbi:MAG TPA: hypothetical protein VIJ88_02990 [Candidatus Paceibacterota bacterium]